jgi:hypothetical protein
LQLLRSRYADITAQRDLAGMMHLPYSGQR